MEAAAMRLKILSLMVVLAVLAACAGPGPEQEAAPAGGASMAAPEATPEAAPDGSLADESFESGRTETLQPAEAP
jgi:ABC-type glycerol-3-phosphate transport system substrate-binding protein